MTKCNCNKRRKLNRKRLINSQLWLRSSGSGSGVTVLKYSTPLAVNAAAISSVVTTQARGCPLPIGFPMVTMSGQKTPPSIWKAQKWLPTRPKPVCTSSATNTPPAERTYLWSETDDDWLVNQKTHRWASTNEGRKTHQLAGSHIHRHIQGWIDWNLEDSFPMFLRRVPRRGKSECFVYKDLLCYFGWISWGKNDLTSDTGQWFSKERGHLWNSYSCYKWL